MIVPVTRAQSSDEEEQLEQDISATNKYQAVAAELDMSIDKVYSVDIANERMSWMLVRQLDFFHDWAVERIAALSETSPCVRQVSTKKILQEIAELRELEHNNTDTSPEPLEDGNKLPNLMGSRIRMGTKLL